MSSFIITDVRIFTGETVIPSGFVFVKDGVISLFAAGSPPAHVTASMFSKPGHTLLPGFMDAHVHIDPYPDQGLNQCLKFGVTTVRDMANDPDLIAKLRIAARERKDIADIKSACTGAMVEDGWPAQVILAHDHSPKTRAMLKSGPKVQTPEDVDAFLDANVQNKADYIKLLHECGASMGKSLPSFPKNVQSALVEAAHDRDFLVVAHATYISDTLEVLKAGVDGLTHAIYDEPPTPQLIEAFKKKNAWRNPTLATIGSLTGEGGTLAKQFSNDPRAVSLMPQADKESLSKNLGMATEGASVEHAYESVRQLKAAGIDILCGSDTAAASPGTAFGISLHHELHLLVHKTGFTPQEALTSATSVIANRFGLADRGLIEVRRKADLVLVEGDPLQDIGVTLS